MTLPDDNIPTQAVPIILYEMQRWLEQVLIVNVPETNPTRAVLVKVGRFQDNPIDKNVIVAIQGGDLEDPDYKDGRIDNPELTAIRIKNLPVAEVGGGWAWWRRGTIRFHCFFIRQAYDEDKALKYAYDFYGRLLNAVELTPLEDLQDDYSEMIIPPVYVEGNSFYESGGPDKYIWRGKLSWRVLTWRE